LVKQTGFQFFNHTDDDDNNFGLKWHTCFLETLLKQNSDHSCGEAYSRSITFEPGKSWGDLLLVYNTDDNGFDILISVYGNRWRLENPQNELNITMQGYYSMFQSIFNEYIDQDLAALEQSGILRRVRDKFKMFNSLRMLEKEERYMRMKEKQWINFYTAVNQPKSLVSKFAKENEDDWESTKLKSLVTPYVLFCGMLVAACACFL